ncbi:helix-turn-helix domain-containing protein [Shimia sp. R9_2]|uniref:AraC family transcriptional regulator n=1 Tax=Shimia sp. R9_2 TaxID=2821112 RepID=UPI001ADC8099|nr:AraC family transcriptional regulator [Shimia sp. R9_2]MBO9399150.1 helix-turn-helix domain-containing protein [Shimia sp. R9_2]
MKDQHHTTSKLNAAVRILKRRGLDQKRVFKGTGVDRSKLSDKDYSVSLDQILSVLRNIAEQRWHPAIPYEIGRSLHISDYGLYGYAVLSGTRYPDTVKFAQKFHSLAAPTSEMAFVFDSELQGWTFEPVEAAASSPDFYDFLVCLQVGIFLSLHQDVLGQEFKSNLIEVRCHQNSFYTVDKDAAEAYQLGAEHNRFCVPLVWNDRRLELGNSRTYKQVTEICEEELSEILHSGSGPISGKVRGELIRRASFDANMDQISHNIGLTSRTLRRLLKRENTTFSDILASTRLEVAQKYLRDAELSTQEIAFVLGFSDAASFHRAFRRWTGKTPKQYRNGL